MYGSLAANARCLRAAAVEPDAPKRLVEINKAFHALLMKHHGTTRPAMPAEKVLEPAGGSPLRAYTRE